MKNVMRMMGIIFLSLAMVFLFAACGEKEDTGGNPVTLPGNGTGGNPSKSIERFQANSYTGTNEDRIKYSFTYNDLDFYYIYLGELRNIPLFFDDVHRHSAIASDYTFSTTNITQTMVSQAIARNSSETKSIIEEHTKSKTTEEKFGGEIGAKLSLGKIFDLGGKGYYEKNEIDTDSDTTGTGSQTTTSFTDTIEYGTTHILETMRSRTFHLTKEDKTGFYRFTYFSVSDVYLYVIKDTKTGDFYYEFREHIKPAVGSVEEYHFWDIDYSETASFKKSDATSFEFDVSILENLPKPTLVFDDIHYTIIYNANGGSGTAPDMQTVKTGTLISLPDKGGLSKGTDIFAGWSESLNGNSTTYSVGDSITVTKDMVFYAQWTPTPPPDTPTNLERYGGTRERPPVVYLRWSLVSGAIGYNIYRSLSASDPYIKVGSPTTNLYEDSNVSENTTYYYKVSAYNDTGESPQSSYIMVSVAGSGLQGFGGGD